MPKISKPKHIKIHVSSLSVWISCLQIKRCGEFPGANLTTSLVLQIPKTGAIWGVAVLGSTETLAISVEKAGFCN